MIQELKQNRVAISITAIICLLAVGLFGMAVPAMADSLAPFRGESGTIKVSGGIKTK